jgi:hypothetical protein
MLARRRREFRRELLIFISGGFVMRGFNRTATTMWQLCILQSTLSG